MWLSEQKCGGFVLQQGALRQLDLSVGPTMVVNATIYWRLRLRMYNHPPLVAWLKSFNQVKNIF